MLFFYDTFDRSVEAFGTLEQAAKHILGKLGVSLELGMDPVKQAQKSLGKRGKVVGISGAFGIIAGCPDKEAQETALKFKEALERCRK
ncbi:hypothetical protein [Aliikangiella coralliicola]|uniref:Uncharacterized protein n=1 Tax=Aliikangiella coralliicola TaxID=2592383 RepID=A0A545UGB7_9GAMM|nr:hypothetical protein [Aliikangiella coralliicola]TQV88443.1 hypothetical protein FLL46_07930 [Aliikangiella coralliicola]